jgi:predicted kinase
MIKVEMLVGIPGSGKSTYAKQVVAKDPSNYVRINNDDLRAMMNGSVWSADYEKMITDARNYLIRDALKRGKNVIIDNLNLNRRHFDDVCKIAKSVNTDVQVFEKAFYIELEDALERNSKREGAARVPDDVVKKWWKDSGGKQFRHYHPRVEIFQEHKGNLQSLAEAPANVPGAPEAVLCDLDGTLALIHGRSPYDASDCDIKDFPNVPVIETILAHYAAGRKIIFCSGREDKYRPETVRFIEKWVTHPKYVVKTDTTFGPEGDMVNRPIPYQLHMRKTDDFRKDAIIKEEIYKEHIEGKYNVLLVLDDRDQVVEFWRGKGLTCFQVAYGNF